ncbi:hypothetical protein M9458_005848, partial [Cirrhinus mrigala]
LYRVPGSTKPNTTQSKRVHPEYNNLPHDNDMALLHLSSPVTFTNYIRPVCLAAEGSTFNSDT